MSTRLGKWGNSLALRIPKAVAEGAQLKEGDAVAVAVNKDGSVVIRPTRGKYTLKPTAPMSCRGSLE